MSAFTQSIVTTTTTGSAPPLMEERHIIGCMDELEEIRGNGRIQGVEFHSMEFDPEDVREIARILRNHPSITHIYITECDGDFSWIVPVLRKRPLMHLEIDVLHEKIDFLPLICYLQRNCHLETLVLGDVQLSQEELDALGRLLRVNHTLRTLDLGTNRYGHGNPLDLTKMARGLAVNTTLTNLDLSYNIIDEDGFRQLAKGLRRNTNLRELSLRNCDEISDESLVALAKAVRSHPTLQVIDLSIEYEYDFEVSESGEGAIAFAKTLRVNPRITTLRFHEVPDHAIEALLDAVVDTPERLWIDDRGYEDLRASLPESDDDAESDEDAESDNEDAEYDESDDTESDEDEDDDEYDESDEDEDAESDDEYDESDEDEDADDAESDEDEDADDAESDEDEDADETVDTELVEDDSDEDESPPPSKKTCLRADSPL